MLDYQEVKHAADGKLATNLTITTDSGFSTAVRFPQASALEVKNTWGCWVFLEGALGRLDGNSELETVRVDDVKLTHFAVAAGEKGEVSISVLGRTSYLPNCRYNETIQCHAQERRRPRRVYP